MRKVRIGNDINVRWEVKTDGQAVSLEGKALKLYVRSAYRKEEITTFTVEGCVVSFTYPASMQRMTGARAVILEDATEGAPRRTVCADQAFTLVAHSCEENDDDVEFENFLVSLQSNVLIGKPGMSAYEVWLSEGNTGTLADWYAYLQKPATDVAAKVTKAETVRVEAEKKREDAENARAEAETARQDAENGRDTAEQERAGNEDTRKTAEQSRNTAELDRRTDENIRTENESARMTEENKRIAAERQRAATFSALSADVDAVVGKANTAIEETDAAEALRVDAEAGRTRAEDERETNEQKRKLGETERKSAEMQREEVEESRVAAENSRVTAEKQRYDAERERRQHEDAREDSEGKRDTAERLRKQAETGRDNAEQERTASEQTRMENETQRETNEQKREEAEDKREEAIVKFENDFNEKLDLKADLEQFNNTVSGINANIATKANAQDVTNAIGELQDKIGDRVVVSGNVTNNPDEEDITTEGDTPQTQVLKLKDRAYDSLNASGKGYKILRKNWQPINGERKNVLTQAMINEPNTIYEIRYDFDLNGEEIEIKEGCVLKFCGGTLINGGIVGNKTRLSNLVKLNNITINGTFENEYCKTSYYTDNDDNNVSNLNNLFKISRNVIIDLNKYIISEQLTLPCDTNLSCSIGCSILLKKLGCIYVTHSNKLSDINIYVDDDFRNTEHIIVIDTKYIYKSIENITKSYASLFNIYIDNVFIDNNKVKIDKIIDIYNDSKKNGWNVNVSNCVFQCVSNKAISLVTKGKGSWLNGTYFSNVKTVYSTVGFYIDSVENSIPPENVSIIQCSMQCIKTSTHFVEAKAVHRLYVFSCEPWDWNTVTTNPFLFTNRCDGVTVMASGAYSDYDYEGDITSNYNTINYMCGQYSANIGNFYTTPRPKGDKFTLKEIQTIPRGVYKISADSTEGNKWGITSPNGGVMIVDGGAQGAVFITYFDANKEIYFYSNNRMLDRLEDRAITSNDWVKMGKIEQVERPRDYNLFKLYRNSNDKLYFLDGGGNRRDVLGRTFQRKESTDGLDTSKLNSLLDVGRVFYSPYQNKICMWTGSKLIDAFGYESSKKKKGTSADRPSIDETQSGFQYYDTTLKKYIVWNGTEWTNMDGSSLGE